MEDFLNNVAAGDGIYTLGLEEFDYIGADFKKPIQDTTEDSSFGFKLNTAIQQAVSTSHLNVHMHFLIWDYPLMNSVY